ncbi:MAG: hypothetical protein WCI93_02415 [bacterium]
MFENFKNKVEVGAAILFSSFLVSCQQMPEQQNLAEIMKKNSIEVNDIKKIPNLDSVSTILLDEKFLQEIKNLPDLTKINEYNNGYEKGETIEGDMVMGGAGFYQKWTSVAAEEGFNKGVTIQNRKENEVTPEINGKETPMSYFESEDISYYFTADGYFCVNKKTKESNSNLNQEVEESETEIGMVIIDPKTGVIVKAWLGDPTTKNGDYYSIDNDGKLVGSNKTVKEATAFVTEQLNLFMNTFNKLKSEKIIE